MDPFVLDIALPLARGLHLAAMLSTFGTMAFAALIAPAVFPLAVPRLAALINGSAALTGMTALLWLVLQAGAMAGADSLAAMFEAVPIALGQTHFGTALIARLALIAGAVVLKARGAVWIAATLAAAATALQGEMAHAAAAEGWLLPLSEVLHVMAAGAWLGALVPLWLLVRAVPPRAAAIAARRFSALGMACVSTLALTAVAQGSALIGGLSGLLGTPYGLVALAKLGLFGALLLLAAVNRFELTPALDAEPPAAARRWLARTILGEIALGLAVVIAAAWLATLAPALHEMPRVNLSLRPRLGAAAPLALAAIIVVALALVALAWRQWRWRGGLLAAAAIAAVLAWQLDIERGPVLLDGEGVVLSTQLDPPLLTVDGDEIPGFMAAMQMDYNVASPALLAGIKARDRVRFTIDTASDAVTAITVLEPAPR